MLHTKNKRKPILVILWELKKGNKLVSNFYYLNYNFWRAYYRYYGYTLIKSDLE